MPLGRNTSPMYIVFIASTCAAAAVLLCCLPNYELSYPGLHNCAGFVRWQQVDIEPIEQPPASSLYCLQLTHSICSISCPEIRSFQLRERRIPCSHMTLGLSARQLPSASPSCVVCLMQGEGRRGVWNPRLLHSSAAVRHCAHEGGAAPLLRHVQLLDDRPPHPVHLLHLCLHW